MTTRLRRLLVVGIIGILLLLLVRAGLDLWATRRVDAAVARLEERYGWLHEGTLNVPPVPVGDNRARAYRAAAALIDLTPLAHEFNLGASLSRLRQAEPGTQLPDALRALVVANPAALRLADEARARPQSNWEGDYIQSATATGPPWAEVRALSNLLYLATLRDLEDGRVDDAAVMIASGLALSASVRQEPNLIAQLIRSAFGTQHFEGVQRLLTQAEPSRTSLDELARRLAEDREPRPMDIGLRGELTLLHAGFVRVENGERGIGTMGELPSWTGPLATLGRPLVRLEHARYLEALGQLLDVQTGPRPRPAVETPTQSRWSFLKGTVHVALPGLVRTMDTSDQFTTHHGLAELAVALRRYRLDRGAYPDALSALVPNYLPALAIDASTGLPPVYTREGVGFRLRAEPMKGATGQRATAFDWAVPR